MSLLGTVAVGLILFVTLAWMSMGSLRKEVMGRSQDWDAVASVGWSGKLWNGSLIPRSEDGQYASYATNQIWTTNQDSFPLGEFHARLQKSASSEVKDSLLTPGLAGTYNGFVQKSQRIVFENGVVMPLLEASRQKMLQPLSDSAEDRKYLPGALIAMVQMEAHLWSRGTEENLAEVSGQIDAETAEQWLNAMLAYVTGGSAALDPALPQTMSWTYSVNEEGKGQWPPNWIAGGQGVTNRLDLNPSLKAGLDHFLAIVGGEIGGQVDAWTETDLLQSGILSFQKAEMALQQAAVQSSAEAYKAAYADLKKAKATIDEQQAELRKHAFFKDAGSLTNAFAQFQAQARAGIKTGLAPMRAALAPGLLNGGNRMFVEMHAKLNNLEKEQRAKLLAYDDVEKVEALAKLESFFYVSPGAEERWSILAEVGEAITARPFDGKKLVGQRGAPLNDFLSSIVKPVPVKARAYAGTQKMELVATADYGATLAESSQRAAFIQTYVQEVETEIATKAGFPFLRQVEKPIKLDMANEFKTYLGLVTRELSSDVFMHPDVANYEPWKKLRQDLLHLDQIAQAILDRNGAPTTCQVLLTKMDAQLEATKDNWRLKYRKFKIGADTEWEDTNIAADGSMGDVAVDSELSLWIAQRGNEGEKHEYKVPMWGALWLLHKYEGAVGTDATSWSVDVPVELFDQAAKGSVRLILKFEKPLPKLESWPSR